MKKYRLEHYALSDRYFISDQDLSIVHGACGSFQKMDDFGYDYPLPKNDYRILTIDEAWELIVE